jgi:hypothetical protein
MSDGDGGLSDTALQQEERRVEAKSGGFKKELGLGDLVLTQSLFIIGLPWIGVAAKHPMNRLVHELISIPARWRLDHHVYSFPIELRVKNVANRLFPAPKTKVDAHQLPAEVVTC